MTVTTKPNIFNQPWRERALCAQIGFELFFPETNRVPREAKRVCGMCEVSVECLDYAVTNCEKEGVWGGKSPHERSSIRREMKEGG